MRISASPYSEIYEQKKYAVLALIGKGYDPFSIKNILETSLLSVIGIRRQFYRRFRPLLMKNGEDKYILTRLGKKYIKNYKPKNWEGSIYEYWLRGEDPDFLFKSLKKVSFINLKARVK